MNTIDPKQRPGAWERGFAHEAQRESALLQGWVAALPARALPGIALAFTLVTWGSAFPAIRAALRGYGPGELAFGRFLAASVTLALLAPLAGVRPPSRRDLPRLALAAFLSVALYHTLLNFGQQTVTAGSASLVIAMMPPLTALGAVIFLGERMAGHGWLGIVVSVGGVALIAVGDAEGVRVDPGVGLIAIAAASFAAANILLKPLLERYSPFEIAAFATWGGTALLAVFGPGLAGEVRDASVVSTASLIYLGAVPAAAGTFTWAYALRALTASVASAALLLIPFVAIAIAWVWLGEIPSALALAGGSLTLAGVLLVRSGARASTPRRPDGDVRIRPAKNASPTPERRVPCPSP